MAVAPVGNRLQPTAQPEASTAVAQRVRTGEATGTAVPREPALAEARQVRLARQQDVFESGVATASASATATAGGTATASAAAAVSVNGDGQVAAYANGDVDGVDSFDAPQELTTHDILGAEDPQLALADPLAGENAMATGEDLSGLNDALTGLDNLLTDLGSTADPESAPVFEALNSMVDVLQNLVQTIDPGVGQSGDSAITPPGGDIDLPGMGGGPGAAGTKPGAFGIPGIDQQDPNGDGANFNYVGGQTNCGPTAMAQIARGRSMQDPNFSINVPNGDGTVTPRRVADMTNEELVSTLGQIGKTNIGGEGTSPNGIVDMAAALGLPVDTTERLFDASFQKGGSSNSFNGQWISDQLAQGKQVIINGAYNATDANGNTEQVGHFVTVAGQYPNGNFAIVDPLDGTTKELTPDQLARFMQNNPTNGGVGIAIG